MSKIAELLKLAEKKKEDLKIELPSPLITNTEDGVSKSKQVGVIVSKGKVEGVRVSKSKEEELEVSNGRKLQNSITNQPVETSPTKDFTKVSNSIMKRAIPEKYFRGLSKHTYDILYQRTRGAINPTRTIQLTKDELVRLTGISKDTIKLHIKYLKETGLLNSKPAIGIHAGWEYEIFVPEEIEETEQVGVSVSRSNTGQNLPLDRGQNLPLLTPTNTIENKHTYEFPNTSFKTNTKDDDDDEKSAALSELAEKLDAISRKLTGKGVSMRETEKWGTLADLLILELEVAAKRTDSISSVPAFLTEVLRRRFFTLRQQVSSAKPSKTKVDTVGKPSGENFEIKPLDKQGREEALEQLREFAEDDFLHDFKKWYVEEDWNWMMKELGIS